jgi:hypothetical protein
MFCTQCGSEVEQHARFCSKCGQEVSTRIEPAPGQVRAKTKPDMNMHINILAWLLIGSAILTGIGGMIVLFVGQVFLQHWIVPMPPDIPPGMPPFVGWLTSLVGFSVLALAAATAAAGVGLLQYRSWARVFAIVVAILMLFNLPIGTIIGIYALWVLFSQEGQAYYKKRSESTMTASGT